MIYDLRCANNRARIHVQLVSAAGVGTVAAGVAKAHADVVLISGHDGGDGCCGTLVHPPRGYAVGDWAGRNSSRPWCSTGYAIGSSSSVTGVCARRGTSSLLRCWAGRKTGLSTAPLIAAGCVMMRVCHLDTCPVGVATQNPELRERFTGRPEYVERLLRFIAADVRRLLAELGFRSIDDALGHADVLEMSPAVAH